MRQFKSRNTSHKFSAKPVKSGDGYHFASTLEYTYYKKLLLLQTAGEVLFFLRQVPFHLAPDLKMVIDFQVFYADGRVEFIEVKGFETALYIAKKKMLEELYPVDLIVVK